MNENLKKIFDQLSTDSTLREKFVEQPSLEAAYAFAAEAVPGLTLEEFTAMLEELSQVAGKKLTEEELEKVGGGMALDKKVWWIPLYSPEAERYLRELAERGIQ